MSQPLDPSSPRFSALCDAYHQAVFDIQRAGAPYALHSEVCASLGLNPNTDGAVIKDHLHNTGRILAQVKMGDEVTPFGLEHPIVDYEVTCR